MGFLYFLEGLRNPVLNTFFSLITHLGEETVFLAVSLLVFWCVNKREGYYILMTGLIGTLINQSMKLLFRVGRPWVLDPSFTVVESAKGQAADYSFPSGHTQNAVGTFGVLAGAHRHTWQRVLFLALAVLVPFSRMWLGMHTPWDVLCAAALALLLLLLLQPVFATEERFHRFMPYLVILAYLLSLLALLFARFQPPELHTGDNLAAGLKNIVTLHACTLALIPIWFLDRHLVHFETAGSWYVQCLKLTVGLGTTLLLKWGLTAPLEACIYSYYVARGVRYFLVVLYAGLLYPMCFRFLARWHSPALDALPGRLHARLSRRGQGENA